MRVIDVSLPLPAGLYPKKTQQSILIKVRLTSSGLLLEIFFVAVMLPKVMASSVAVAAGVSSLEAAGADPEVESLIDPN